MLYGITAPKHCILKSLNITVPLSPSYSKSTKSIIFYDSACIPNLSKLQFEESDKIKSSKQLNISFGFIQWSGQQK